MRARVLTAGSLILLMAVAALAQFGGPRGPFHEYPNIPYDGQFTFVRLKYAHGPGGNWYGGWLTRPRQDQRDAIGEHVGG